MPSARLFAERFRRPPPGTRAVNMEAMVRFELTQGSLRKNCSAGWSYIAVCEKVGRGVSDQHVLLLHNHTTVAFCRDEPRPDKIFGGR